MMREEPVFELAENSFGTHRDTVASTREVEFLEAGSCGFYVPK